MYGVLGHSRLLSVFLSTTKHNILFLCIFNNNYHKKINNIRSLPHIFDISFKFKLTLFLLLSWPLSTFRHIVFD